MTHRRALGLLLAFGLSWALTIPLVKIAVSTGHQHLGLIFWQLLVATVVLSVVAVVRRISVPINWRTLGYYLVIALTGTVLPNALSYVAAAQLPAGVMAIVIATVPMFALLVALTIRSEQFRLLRFCGVLAGAGAVVMLIGPDGSLPDPQKSIYVLVALVSSLCYAIEGNYVAGSRRPTVDPVAAVLGASVVGLVICAPLAWFGGFWVDMGLPWGRPEQAFMLSSVIHSVVYCGYIWLVGQTSAVFASQIAYVVTLGGVGFSALLLAERYSAWVLAAMVLMVVGLTLVQPRQRSASD